MGAQSFELRHERFGRRTVERVAVFLRRHLRDDRQVADAPHRADGRADLVQIAERLEHEQIDAAFEERRRLLGEVRLGLVDAGLAPGLDADAERADRAGDVDLVARRVPRDARALNVDDAPWSASPKAPSLIRLAPNVLVSMTSAPART